MGMLFKSRKERERSARKDRRQALRHAENALEDVRAEVRKREAAAEREWTRAREALQSGQKDAAQSRLKAYRHTRLLTARLEQKRWVFEQFFSQLQLVETDQSFTHALDALNRLVRIDPEKVESVIDATTDLLAEQSDADQVWERVGRRMAEHSADAPHDETPPLEELEKQLAEEAAVELGGGPARVAGELDARLRSGQERVKNLLDGR